MTIDAKLVATLGAIFFAYCSYSIWTSGRMHRGEFSSSLGRLADQLREANKTSSDGTGESSAGSSPYEPSVADVLVIKAMLNKALSIPPEIVDTIVDIAEYWPHTTTFSDSTVVAGTNYPAENVFLLRSPPLGLHNWERVSHTETSSMDKKPPRPQPANEEFSTDDFQELIASPIPMLAQPCRRIVFTIRSHDQGWGGEFGNHGTYNGSWTWCDVGLERWCKPPTPTQTDATGQQTQQQHDRPTLQLDDLCTVLPEVEWDPEAKAHVFVHPLHPRDDLKIQCNVMAEREPILHRVVWSYTDDIDPERDAEAAAQQLASKGRGTATGNGRFVRDLKLGDVVTIWAKARFQGWSNHVESVKMDVYYAV
ncbi:hypothetical protein C8A00DRAFT_30333 [Chaetomidium leptoderma]|uniref:Uncharacterized protein n=1 Tax=Chaetomidium leptoderma TaxID=669021 RepID=A0AAN6VS38_9PEZI|nr:hypothetical protein C8A00DRAFT_30333 [Chaetomidium leptoderma]